METGSGEAGFHWGNLCPETVSFIYFKNNKKKFFIDVMTFSFKIILATLFYEIISMKVSTLTLSYNMLYLST